MITKERRGANKGPHLNGGSGPRVKAIHFLDGPAHHNTPYRCGVKNTETKLFTSVKERVTCPNCLSNIDKTKGVR